MTKGEAKRHAERVVARARERLDREPSEGELLRWAAVYKRVSQALTILAVDGKGLTSGFREP